ncbi:MULTISPECIES: hypothetical protein [Catenuloplanes]|uniref:Uncharacterized protein n=1 Tax=Catenuloplanes niger TaxID=587534 RepID=A0AAE4CWY7_9ACTN|nr:hypothetical protein [Catenuloplanes niger]MDR7326922.1 hypothetical protein [Catenuloplanes niger]
MARYAVAASGQARGDDNIRQPAGDAHAWLPGTNQTVCGVPLARAGLRRFPHVPWEYRSSDVLTEADEVRHLCERCLAATRPRGARGRGWVRVSPRP